MLVGGAGGSADDARVRQSTEHAHSRWRHNHLTTVEVNNGDLMLRI